MRVSRVIAVSEAVAQTAREAGLGIPASRLVVVHNGVDLTRFAGENPSLRAETRRALGISETAPVALCVARLSPEKNVAHFLESAALIKGFLPDARFLVAGDGPLRPTLERQVGLLNLKGRAQILGERTDIPALLQAADCFCLPSREEGLSIAVIEAMAAGLPVAATRVGGVPEVVDDGNTGMLVPPRDPEALGGALTALLADPAGAKEKGNAGRARAAAHFSEAAMIAGTRAVYEAALGKRA
jgi:glycosyltransferase involved in cell wall biosynthesis